MRGAVAATVFLAEHVDGGGLFNIGSGEPNTFLDLARAIFDALGQVPNIEFIEMPEHLREKHQYYSCADTAKLWAAGYAGKGTPLHDAVSDYVRHYLVLNKYLGDEADHG